MIIRSAMINNVMQWHKNKHNCYQIFPNNLYEFEQLANMIITGAFP